MVNIELVGTQAAPAVIITRREQAVVLFRGSSITQRAVETQLEKRGVKTVELLVDLRMQPETPCDLKAETRIEAAALAADTTRRAACGGVDLELYRTRAGLHRPVDHRRAALCHGKRYRPPCKAHPGRVAAGVDGAAGQHPVHRLPDPEPKVPLDAGKRRRARLPPAPPPRRVSAFQSGRSMIK